MNHDAIKRLFDAFPVAQILKIDEGTAYGKAKFSGADPIFGLTIRAGDAIRWTKWVTRDGRVLEGHIANEAQTPMGVRTVGNSGFAEDDDTWRAALSWAPVLPCTDGWVDAAMQAAQPGDEVVIVEAHCLTNKTASLYLTAKGWATSPNYWSGVARSEKQVASLLRRKSKARLWYIKRPLQARKGGGVEWKSAC